MRLLYYSSQDYRCNEKLEGLGILYWLQRIGFEYLYELSEFAYRDLLFDQAFGAFQL